MSLVVNVMLYIMSVMNRPFHCLVQPIGAHGGEVVYLGVFALRVSLVS